MESEKQGHKRSSSKGKKKKENKASIKRTKGKKHKRESSRGKEKSKDRADKIKRDGSERNVTTCGGLPLEIWKRVLKSCLPPLTGAREGRERLRIMLVCKDWHTLVWLLTRQFDLEDKPQKYLKLVVKRKKKAKKRASLQVFTSHLKQLNDEWFSSITSSFSSLTCLHLSHCDHVSEEALKSLSGLSKLTELSLAYLAATDAGVGAAVAELKDLRKLAVTQTEAVQGSFLRSCSTSLEELDLTDGKGLVVAELAPLANLTKLASLVMMHCGSGVNCSVFKHFPPSLRQLKVSGFLLLEESVQRLSEQPKLEELSLSFTFFNQKRLRALGLLTSLKRLEAIDVRESNFLEEIGSLDSLQHLRVVARFYATRFGPNDLVPLAKLTGLRSLCLDSSGPENDGLSHISHLRALETVVLSLPIVYDSFDFLKGITTLRTLHVVRCEGVKDEAFKKLPTLTELHTTCDDPERKGIQHLASLRTLSLDNCRVSSLRFATNLSCLSTLRITACRSLRDNHIEELVADPSPLPRTLTHLDLSFCNAIGDASTQHILQFTSLVVLRLLGCKFSSSNLNLLDLRLTHLEQFLYPKRLELPPNGK